MHLGKVMWPHKRFEEDARVQPINLTWSNRGGGSILAFEEAIS